ncbi:MAG: hypothetical protein JW881_10080 [Spirochaetales bacterium]|nr:hypothetical protein [Spirochaetales bacterium]
MAKTEYEITDTLTLDDGENGKDVNNLGGPCGPYSDAMQLPDKGKSTITFDRHYSPGHDSGHCLYFTYDLKPGFSTPYAGFMWSLQPGYASMDVSGYSGIRFYARGSGAFRVHFGTDETRKEFNHFGSRPVTLTGDWLPYSISFSELHQRWGTKKSWNSEAVYSFEIHLDSTITKSGEIYIDTIEFYKAVKKEKALHIGPDNGTGIFRTGHRKTVDYLSVLCRAHMDIPVSEHRSVVTSGNSFLAEGIYNIVFPQAVIGFGGTLQSSVLSGRLNLAETMTTYVMAVAASARILTNFNAPLFAGAEIGAGGGIMFFGAPESAEVPAIRPFPVVYLDTSVGSYFGPSVSFALCFQATFLYEGEAFYAGLSPGLAFEIGL